ncbi:Hexamethylene bis-acetamide-inducible protein [Popillia japonica]|uniref:Hexamethylene bis-acetamide-inducible protein n=1 Tax=Popillia japonica TaxID=7064 RepID=A0AAW1K0I5_POPJA
MNVKDAVLNSVVKLPQDDVVHLNNAHATAKHDDPTKMNDVEIPPKKRKTRRGKCKRRNVHPYIKKEIKANNKVVKPEAPYNSNRFLIEDHGNIDEIDEQLRNTDQISNSTVTRTRDSSFSIDSDGEFYSTPDDEEEFLIKDFDDQYQSLQAERLHAMTKSELVEEYLLLESRVEILTKRLRSRMVNTENDKNEETSNQQNDDFQKEIERLRIENENLKQENEMLRNKQMLISCTSDSEDSETDSSDSCSTTSTSSMSKPSSPLPDCPQINGHSPTIIEEAA